MNVSQFKPFKQHSFYDNYIYNTNIRERNPNYIYNPNIRERNPVIIRDPKVFHSAWK